MRHHLRFKNIHPAVVGAAERAFGDAPWSEGPDRQCEIAERFLLSVSRAYGVSPCKFAVDPFRFAPRYIPARRSEDSLGQVSVEAPARIVLLRWSMTDLFVFARQHVLAEGAAERTEEDDPIAWACSLFYRVKPTLFRSRAREGKVYGVTAKDTYTSASWNTLVAANATRNEEWLSVSPAEANEILGSAPAEDDSEPAIMPTDDAQHEFAEESDDEPDKTLEEMTRDEVRALAVELGVPRQGRNKSELIAAIREAL